MSHIRTHGRLLLVAVCCIALGAGVSAIATAGATTGRSAHPAMTGHGAWRAFAGRRGFGARHPGWRGFAARRGGLRGFGAQAVHGTVVVHTRTGFATVTFDRGTVDSVQGQQLTIAEGTPTATYKTVTLTIPSTARIRDNRQSASLSQLRSGQRVMVVQAPKHTFVIARTRP